ncbi:bifunctional glutamate N-acetyltransferase/amino-acid acetyltransferase ArgJ [Thermoflavimicrobium dichotomicum]|uniref:Arginine biosynthesis bifunctional protein ArgJ n=1 Tax=Thermoflavimicrobium dichotomicum TaxID=46223 RepID=A0A1I3NXM4_9BACL|nr:bifunctional glutamate N-acetyltransferase/amino-acid acetyltransferase ArgJ [Thermoflavimicrobium dichotomicum]SFJ14043.1 glutamate N-acetyltransferase / amino-acid N-acetyltransferase [Thermoflavimicrobium dichotomicum]
MQAFEIASQPSITSPQGFRSIGIHAGLKRRKLDLGAIICDVPANAAAVYTKNAFQAAPVKVTKESIQTDRKLQAVVVNSGQANAGTGKRGYQDALATRQRMAELLGIPDHFVAVASTGVIGEYLQMDKLLAGLEQIVEKASHDPEDTFAEAILTTDTFPKKVEVHVQVNGQTVKIAGVAKGSGMIHPNMATMLGFITTDAVIDSKELESLLKTTVNETFNMISVDGDCSTNDMVIVMASGLAGNQALTPIHPDWSHFQAAFHYVCQELAKQIAKDGEGATRLIEVQVEGAPRKELAQQIARAIVSSNLVKAAIFGADPNWGRILCAAGYSAPELDPEHTDISISSVLVAKQGMPVPFDEEKVTELLRNETVVIQVNFHQGDCRATAWGCDLTYDYVKINGSYRS